MLRAILEGKGRRLPETVSASDSLKRAFVQSEDILTAAVFSRLAYLDGPLFWKILSLTFRPAFLPPRTLVEIDDVEFWPTWGQAKGVLNKAVEPDVVFRLSAGDPSQTWALIVECKFGAGVQYAEQWFQQWTAYLAESVATERADNVWLLAIGGLPKGVESTVEQLKRLVQAKHGVELNVAGAEWSDLVKALDVIEPNSSSARRIVDDIKQALRLHGFRQVHPLSDLVDLAQRYKFGDSSAMLRWPHAESEISIADFDSWPTQCTRWRPISTNQFARIR